MDARPSSEAVELIQTLIRNQCVNTGEPGSGHEWRSAQALRSYLEEAGADLETYEPAPGRESLVVRIEGSDPLAPSLLLLGHTDVVPVTPADWRRDRRLARYTSEPVLDDIWHGWVAGQDDLSDEQRAALLDPGRVDDAIAGLEPRMAKQAHACIHTTFSPNMVTGGVKINVIPDEVVLDVDIRTLPGEDDAAVQAHLGEALGELIDDVTVEPLRWSSGATRSPTDTPLYEALGRVIGHAYPGATLLPRLMVGGTDARFFRQRGAIAYGFGLFSPGVTQADLSTRFHGIDERVDVESLRLTTDAWLNLCRDFLG